MKIQVTNETGREVNPHYLFQNQTEEDEENIYEAKSNLWHSKFEQSVQSYPAPGFKDTAPGEWVEAELVWQGLIWDKTSDDGNGGYEWEIIFESVADWFNLRHNIEGEVKKTRQIWKAKAEGESVEQAESRSAAYRFASGECIGSQNPSYEHAVNAFIAGAKWREENPVI